MNQVRRSEELQVGRPTLGSSLLNAALTGVIAGGLAEGAQEVISNDIEGFLHYAPPIAAASLAVDGLKYAYRRVRNY